MPTNVPNDRRRLEHALEVLRRWKREAIKHHAQSIDPGQRARWRQRADDAEYLAFRLELLLRPMAGEPTPPNDTEGDQDQ